MTSSRFNPSLTLVWPQKLWTSSFYGSLNGPSLKSILLMIVLYHQTKTPINFLCRQRLNHKSLIQLSKSLPVKLTETHNKNTKVGIQKIRYSISWTMIFIPIKIYSSFIHFFSRAYIVSHHLFISGSFSPFTIDICYLNYQFWHLLFSNCYSKNFGLIGICQLLDYFC